MRRRGWIGSLLSLAFAVVVGCTAQPAQKTLVVQCDPQNLDSECADKSLARPKKIPQPVTTATDGTFPPSPTPGMTATADAGDAGAPSADAGGDAGAAGPECTALQSCCEALKQAGFSGSADLCLRTVHAAVEAACRTMHDDNKKPTDETDFVCE